MHFDPPHDRADEAAGLAVQERIERDQFIAMRQEAAQDAVLQVRPVFFGTMLFGFLIIAAATYFEVKSVYILVITYRMPCDAPLWRWLLGHICFGILRESCATRMKNALLFGHLFWTLHGFYWFNLSRSCKHTSPELFNWVELVLVVAAVFIFVSTLLPVLMYASVLIFVILVDRGVISNHKAARPGTLERLEVVTFSPGIFAPADARDDLRPAGECCCCTEAFGEDRTIVMTPCGHYYHKDCLGDWLKLAKTCPLCRSDLDQAVWSGTHPRTLEAASSDVESSLPLEPTSSQP